MVFGDGEKVNSILFFLLYGFLPAGLALRRRLLHILRIFGGLRLLLLSQLPPRTSRWRRAAQLGPLYLLCIPPHRRWRSRCLHILPIVVFIVMAQVRSTRTYFSQKSRFSSLIHKCAASTRFKSVLRAQSHPVTQMPTRLAPKTRAQDFFAF
jgi:hypothetical protein